MIKRRHIATVVMSVGVLGKLNAAGAYAALPENATRASLSATAPAPPAEQQFDGPVGHLKLSPGSPQPAFNVAYGDDGGDDGHHHRVVPLAPLTPLTPARPVHPGHMVTTAMTGMTDMTTDKGIGLQRGRTGSICPRIELGGGHERGS